MHEVCSPLFVPQVVPVARVCAAFVARSVSRAVHSIVFSVICSTFCLFLSASRTQAPKSEKYKMQTTVLIWLCVACCKRQ